MESLIKMPEENAILGYTGRIQRVLTQKLSQYTPNCVYNTKIYMGSQSHERNQRSSKSVSIN